MAALGRQHFRSTGDDMAAKQGFNGAWEHFQIEDHADGTIPIL